MSLLLFNKKYFMKSLFKFILEEAPKTDNAIYYRLGKNKYSWVGKRNDRREPVDRKYGTNGGKSREGLIRYAKGEMPKILPDEKEVVHRKYWDLPGLIGETEKQLLHPAYWNLTEYIQKYHKRHSDILTIFECSSAKPYSTSSFLSRFIKRFNGLSDFACISNPGIVPMEYSHFYPYRYDEWDHFAEKDDIADKYVKVNIGRLIKYKKELGYKHVLVLMQHPSPQKAIDIMYDKNIENCRDWLHIISNDNFRKTLKEKYYSKYNNNMGLLYTRTMGTTYTMDTYIRYLNKYLDSNGKDMLKDIKDLMDEYSGSTLDKKLSEYRKEHDLPDIDLQYGADNKWSVLGPADIDKDMIGKFNKFIKSKLDNFKISSSEDYHNDRIYFTVLDMLIDFYNKPDYIKDPDLLYWTMKKSLDDYMKSNNNLKRIYEYVYYLDSSLDELKIKKTDIIKDANKIGVLQTDDKRKNKQKED